MGRPERRKRNGTSPNNKKQKRAVPKDATSMALARSIRKWHMGRTERRKRIGTGPKR